MRIGRVTRDEVFFYGPPTVARRPSTVAGRSGGVERWSESLKHWPVKALRGVQRLRHG
jgi:hypothetical protein